MFFVLRCIARSKPTCPLINADGCHCMLHFTLRILLDVSVPRGYGTAFNSHQKICPHLPLLWKNFFHDNNLTDKPCSWCCGTATIIILLSWIYFACIKIRAGTASGNFTLCGKIVRKRLADCQRRQLLHSCNHRSTQYWKKHFHYGSIYCFLLVEFWPVRCWTQVPSRCCE